MRLYEGTIEEFSSDVLLNRIADKIRDAYKAYYHKNATNSEYNSWLHSLMHLNNAFTYCNLTDNYVVIEYELPLSSGRIDGLIFGKNQNNDDSVVIVELKQWSNDSVKDSENEGNVFAYFRRGWDELPHPSLQVQNYQSYLREFMTVFQTDNDIFLQSCVYCHNYSKNRRPCILSAEKFKRFYSLYPIFFKEEVQILGDYLKERLNKGDGLAVFNRFIRSPIRPSKKLLDHTSDMIDRQQIFNLIDDQITAYNAIKQRAKNIVKTGRKSVIIVKGGPGTGKSVIALEIMADLMRKGISVYHATGSSAFTNTLRNILGPRINGYPVRHFFNFFFSYTTHEDNSVDVLICDEAHRIRRDSNDYGVPNKYRSTEPQVDDLIRPAKLAVFFLDEHQIVRPKEIGSIQLIKESARKFGVKETDIVEYELKTQFRCSGSNTYLQWVEKMLGLVDYDVTAFDTQMDFEIVDSPHKLKSIIDEKNSASSRKDKARLVAGFCWPWSEPKEDGSLVKDVKIGDFGMTWEHKKQFWKWATSPEGANQVGTVYTSQGFEFDHIGIIWGPDLVFDHERKKWVSRPEKSYDKAVTRNNAELTLHLKHVYRVLLSRAHEGVYIYFMDKGTEEYFRSHLETPTSKTRSIESTTRQDSYLDRILSEIEEKDKFKSHLPVYSLAAAAGKFGESQDVHEEGWMDVDIGKRLNERMFIAKVIGHSMEPAIPNNSYCVFRLYSGGSRQGKIVLAQHHDIADPETGGSYTVKKYRSEKKYEEDGTWRHTMIVLEPLNKEFESIIIPESGKSEFKIIAEFIALLQS